MGEEGSVRPMRAGINGMSLCSNLQYALHRKIAFVIRALLPIQF